MWSDIKLVTTMVRNSRDTRRAGGNGVFDNNVAATADGALSKGSQFQAGILTFKDGVSVTAGLETEVSGTAAAKGAMFGMLYDRYRELAQRLQVYYLVPSHNL